MVLLLLLRRGESTKRKSELLMVLKEKAWKGEGKINLGAY
jgi:hypothetical protein